MADMIMRMIYSLRIHEIIHKVVVDIFFFFFFLHI